jgi:hypothetical protein
VYLLAMLIGPFREYQDISDPAKDSVALRISILARRPAFVNALMAF